MATLNQPSIFISYSRKDKDFVQRLAGDLDRAGYDTWWDVGDLRGGQAWAIEIEKHVRACDTFLVVLSPDSKNSDWVSKETLLALELHKPIVPLMWRESSLPLPLVDRQIIDFQGTYERGFQELLSALPPLRQNQVPDSARTPPSPTQPREKTTIEISRRNLYLMIAAGVLVILGLTWIIGSRLGAPSQPGPVGTNTATFTFYPLLTESTGEGTGDLPGTATEIMRQALEATQATAKMATLQAAKTAAVAATQTEIARQTKEPSLATAYAQRTKAAIEKTNQAYAHSQLSNWPMAGHDSANTNWNPDESLLLPPLSMTWQFTPFGNIDLFENVTINGETALLAGTTNGQASHVLVAINAHSGKLSWRFDLSGGRGSIGVQPAIFKNLAYLGGQDDDHLYALDIASGQLKWQLDGMVGLYDRHPLISNGVVYVGAMDNNQTILAIDGASGKIKWKATGESRQSDYLLLGGILTRGNGPLVGINAASGEKIWETTGRAGFHISAGNGLVFAAYTGDTPEKMDEYPYYRFDLVAAFNKYGKQVWETELEPNLIYANLAFDGQKLYVLTWNRDDPNSRLYVLDPGTGALVNQVSLSARFFRMAGANRVLYLCGDGLVATDTTTLKTIWNAGLNQCSHLAIAQGRLYVVQPWAQGLAVFTP